MWLMQSRTQSTPLKMNTNTNTNKAITINTQSTNNRKDAQQMQEMQQQQQQQQLQQEDDCEPQYFSNAMSVLPADGHGSYYVIYHRDSVECRDDCDGDELTTSPRSGTRRDRTASTENVIFVEANSNSMVDTTPKRIVYEKNAGSSPRRRSSSHSQVFDFDDDDMMYSYDVDCGIDEGCASHAAATCVACFIRVLHFLQFFMGAEGDEEESMI